VYQGDHVTDHRGNDRCVVCHLPRDRVDVHPLPEVSDEVRDEGLRRV